MCSHIGKFNFDKKRTNGEVELYNDLRCPEDEISTRSIHIECLHVTWLLDSLLCNYALLREHYRFKR